MSQRERAGQQGISLVEVLVAMSVLAIVMTGFARLVAGSAQSMSLSQARQEAYTAATLALESARALDFEYVRHVADATGASPLGFDRFDPVEGTRNAPGSAEKVHVHASTGGISSEPPFRIERAGFVLYTVVTLPDESDTDQVRVTAVVEFERAGRDESMRQSTLVNSNVTWGLGQPAFRVSPVDASVPIQTGDRRCVEHTVTNEGGLADQYRVLAPTPPNVPPGLEHYDVDFYEVRHGDVASVLIPGALTVDYDSGEQFTLRACYDATAEAETVDAVEYTIQSERAFMSSEAEELASRSQQIVHGLEVEKERLLYLGHRGPEVRDASVPYVMIKEAPPVASELPNVDLDVDHRPGLQLAPGAPPPGGEARWRHAPGPERTVERAELTFWYSSPAAYDGTLLPQPTPGEPFAGTEPAEAEPTAVEPVLPEPFVSVRATLRHLDPDGELMATVRESVVQLPLENGVWLPTVFDLGTLGVDFAPGDELELALSCDASSAQPCLLAFGAEDHPARLQLWFP